MSSRLPRPSSISDEISLVSSRYAAAAPSLVQEAADLLQQLEPLWPLAFQWKDLLRRGTNLTYGMTRNFNNRNHSLSTLTSVALSNDMPTSPAVTEDPIGSPAVFSHDYVWPWGEYSDIFAFARKSTFVTKFSHEHQLKSMSHSTEGLSFTDDNSMRLPAFG